MAPHFDEQTLAAFATARAAVDTGEAHADEYRLAVLEPASARVSALRDTRTRLGAPPVSANYATAMDWTRARDQHTFDTEHCDRDLAESERLLEIAVTEHSRLLVEVPPLRQAYRRLVLAALDGLAAKKLQEAADVATLRQSLLSATPMEEWSVVAPPTERRNPSYRVESGGWPDVSIFRASAQGGGFTADKSAALVAELGLS